MTDQVETSLHQSEPLALRIPDLATPLYLRVHGEQDQYLSRQIRAHGIWEPYETSLLLSLLQPGQVVVDVGANVGYFSVLAASVVGPDGAVFAFEPDPANCQLLEENARLNHLETWLTVVPAGLADKAGTGQLFLSADNFGDHQIFAAEQGRASVPITLYHGATFLEERLQRLDFLKVDVQGAEYQVLQGLLPLLRQLPRLPVIMLELTPLSLRQAGASGRALIELLAGLGQPLWIIDHVEHRLVASSAGELAGWCDDVDAVAGDAGFMNILAGAIDPASLT